jgi:hypothetical protein
MKKDTQNIFFLISAFVVVIVVALLIFFLVAQFIPELPDRALFGDSFGFVNTIFSGLALFAISYSLLTQIRSFSLQQEDLKLTREELKKTAEAQIESQKQLEKQVKIMAYQSMISAYSDFYRNRAILYKSHGDSRDAGRSDRSDQYKSMDKDLMEKIKPIIEKIEFEINQLEKPNN